MRTISADTETFGTTGPIYGIGAHNETNETKIWFGTIDCRTQRVSWSPQQLKELHQWFDDALWIGHNMGCFDKPKLEAQPFGLRCANYEDTMPASHVYNSQESHDLKQLELTKLRILRDDESQLKLLTQLSVKIVKACKMFMRKSRKSELLRHVHMSDIPKFAGIELPEGDWQASMWLTRVIFPNETITEKYLRRDCEAPLLLWKGRNKWPGYRRCLISLDLYEFYGTHKRYHPVVNSMRSNGIRLFRQKAEKRYEEYASRISAIERRFEIAHGKHPGSSKQMSELLFDKLKFPVVKEKEPDSKWASTDRDVINSLLERYPNHRNITWVDALGDYRELTTDLSDIEGYLKAANAEDIISVNINPVKARTTRGSCTDPNLQNVNKRKDRTLRDLFGPRKGMWWYSWDMKQLELWIIAYLSQDKTLNEWLREGRNVFMLLGDLVCKNCDLRKYLGTDMSRGIGKTLTYGISYGAGPDKVAATIRQRLKVTIDEPKILHDTFFGLFPKIRVLQGRLQSEVEDRGYILTAQGYRLFVSDAEPHAALDYAAQGTAGWHIKQVAVRIWEEIVSQRDDIVFALDVHDQLIFEGRPNLSNEILVTIKTIMEDNGVPGLTTPVALTIIKTNWADEKDAYLSTKGKLVYGKRAA